MIHISLLHNSLYTCMYVTMYVWLYLYLFLFFNLKKKVFFKDCNKFAVCIIKYKLLKVFTTLDQDNGGYSKNLLGLQGSD